MCEKKVALYCKLAAIRRRGLQRASGLVSLVAPWVLAGALIFSDGQLLFSEVKAEKGPFAASTPPVTLITRYGNTGFGPVQFLLSDYGVGVYTEGQCLNGQRPIKDWIIIGNPRFDLSTPGQERIPIYGDPNVSKPC